MKRINILLINSSEHTIWSRRVCGILHIQKDPEFAVIEKHISITGQPDSASAVRHCIPEKKTTDVVLLLDPGLPRAPEIIRQIVQTLPGTPILLITESATPRELISLLNAGASDFIIPPIGSTSLVSRLLKSLPAFKPKDSEFHKLKERLGLKQLIGESEIFKREILKLLLISSCDSGVLISGETGTGKELVARAIHYLSRRSSKPFVPVSCGAIPADLLENELFGHEKGAYTSASSRQQGLIELAEGGTLFLDDVDCLPEQVQPKLLRFLELKEFRPLGASDFKTGEIRIIAATNTDLIGIVEEGKFRADLFYRLDVMPIDLPPLRDRMEDILILAIHFLNKYSKDFNKPACSFTPAAREKLLHYHWPGNVRELKHVMERSIALAEKTVLDADDLNLHSIQEASSLGSFNEEKKKLIARFERSYIEKSLFANQGNITRAAQGAGKDRRTFWGLIRKHGIKVHRFRNKDYWEDLA